ncbi:DEKNAAC101838 [Brettanomyces naardenensis]|uniref:DEKNAAC101838 n=1 Tax=Brettanomyces naardenensis TaxID=13370 RepID=A0A448YJ39_BRENA|nr:DEKNAAC101838 [Brettanomyces naardenensis]
MSDIQRPIEINDFSVAIRDLTNEQLNTVKRRLTNSVAKLEQSNGLMTDLMNNDIEKANRDSLGDDDDDTDNGYEKVTDDDAKLYKDSIRGNEKVIDNQKLRVVAIDLELESRGSAVSEKDLDIPASTGPIISTVISTDNDIVDATAPNSVIL